jgi:hypothetical protein
MVHKWIHTNLLNRVDLTLTLAHDTNPDLFGVVWGKAINKLTYTGTYRHPTAPLELLWKCTCQAGNLLRQKDKISIKRQYQKYHHHRFIDMYLSDDSGGSMSHCHVSALNVSIYRRDEYVWDCIVSH